MNPSATIRHKGIVKWFNTVQGFGFIGIEPSLKLELGIGAEFDLYVHTKNLRMKFPRNLVAEQRVEFTVGRAEKGWRAEDVEVVA